MKKPLIISLILLWVWLAVTLSADYYLVGGQIAIKENNAGGIPATVGLLMHGKREIRIDKFLLVWLLLPPVIGFPILRRLFSLPPIPVPTILQRFWRRLTKPTE